MDATAGDSVFVGWCQDEEDPEAAQVLRAYSAFDAQARALEKAQALVPETRSGIWETLRDAIGCLTDPQIAASTLPGRAVDSFDVEAFVREARSLYVIGSERNAATCAPLITAFVQQGRWGREGADTLFDNTTALTIFGGLKSDKVLKWASTMAGRRLDERRSTQHGRLSWADPGRSQIGEDRVDTLDPGAIRQIPTGRALLIMRAMPPLIVRLYPAWKRPDWRQLHKDRALIRSGAYRQQPIDDPTMTSRRELEPAP